MPGPTSTTRTTLGLADYAALGVFISYFTAILFLFDLILGDLKKAWRTTQRNGSGKDVGGGTEHRRGRGKVLLFGALTVASFAHTWYYMFQYMAWSFANYHKLNPTAAATTTIERVASWLRNTTLFEEAWGAVCKQPLNWWWSEQLCLFTAGAWTIFLAVQAKRYHIPHVWAYMILGQIVAISVASNLFYAAILLSSPSTSPTRRNSTWSAGPLLWIPVSLSLITVYLSPFTDDKTFLPNLLVMHALLVVPLLSDSSTSAADDTNASPLALELSTLYRLVSTAASALHISTVITTVQALQGQYKELALLDTPLVLAQHAWKTLHSHPAQSSIGWDVVWTSIGFIVWTAVENGFFGASTLYLLLSTPLTSIGGTAPFTLRQEEGSLQKTRSNTGAERKDI